MAFNLPISQVKQPLIQMNGDCSLIQLKEVSKVFKSSAGEFTALKNVSLCFAQGEFISIMGKSGSGKSTLINMISGIDHPSSGSVKVGDVEVHGMSEGELAVWRGKNLGIVFQFFQLLPTLTVLENTILPMDFCNMYAPGERVARAMALLEMVNLQGVADKLPAALSGGQQQTAAIARALANDPPLIVADEPTGNLDSRTAETVLNIFDNLVRQDKTIIIVTHDPALAQRASRRVIIADGELVNEFVAWALPMISHKQMLKVSQQAVLHRYEPGRSVLQRGGGEAGLFIITQGQVEVWHKDRKGELKLLDSLDPGDYFCSLDLLETRPLDLDIRASSAWPVEVLWLNPVFLNQLLDESHLTASSLQRTAQERQARYQAQLGRVVKKSWWRR
jgi:ABC-type lipoprotein export system ATPase subunit